ncbi:DUF3757 domain-containing protein [Pseudomonas sp. 15FMM2]|uniref:DUF3757 domain-containing protein n=1 Tax=Pseudomonas imrae TaxID=2992837 RepID=A0ACC7PB25_9PSED
MAARLVFLIFFGISCAAQGEGRQGCPYPSSIKYADGYFYKNSAGHRWASPQVPPGDFIDKFVGAVFVPRKEQELKQGYLEKCIYRTGRDQLLVALRYTRTRAGLSMSLTENLYWRPGKDSFDQDIFQCDDSQPDNCSFTLDHPQY